MLDYKTFCKKHNFEENGISKEAFNIYLHSAKEKQKINGQKLFEDICDYLDYSNSKELWSPRLEPYFQKMLSKLLETCLDILPVMVLQELLESEGK